MLTTEKKYFKFVNFSVLFNWSVQYLSETRIAFNANYQMVRIGEFLRRNKTVINIEDDVRYTRITIKIRNGGVVIRDTKIGKDIGTKRQFLISQGQFILSKIDARNGAMGIIPEALGGAIVTQDFLPYDINKDKINPQYLVLVSTTAGFVAFCQSCSSGTTNRQRIDESKFLDIKIPLPTIEEQNELLRAYNDRLKKAVELEVEALKLETQIESYLLNALGVDLSKSESIINKNFLNFIAFKKIREWGLDKIIIKNSYISDKFKLINLENNPIFVKEVFRGKSPKYANTKGYKILNQKCIRWNRIELEWAKTVDENWLKRIDKKFFTQENDILINSTGEGTIGRSSIVQKEQSDLLYDSHVLLLRFNEKIINPTFYVEVFNSIYGQSLVNNVKSAQSTKQTELGINNLLKIQLPIPPLAIQDEIVTLITEQKNKIKTLKSEAETHRSNALAEFGKRIFN